MLWGFFAFFFFFLREAGDGKEKEESCLPGEDADLTEIQYTNYS